MKLASLKKIAKVFGSICIALFLLDIIALSIFTLHLKDSVILRPKGGIGNQLFQFSAAYSFALNNEKVLYITVIDEQSKDQTTDPLNRSYMLHHFNIKSENIIFIDDIWVTVAKKVRSNLFNRLFLNKIFNIVLLDETNFFEYQKVENKAKSISIVNSNAVFDSEIFFKDYREEILKQLEFKNINTEKLHSTLQEIKASQSVCVHIRRGDMINKAIHAQSTGFPQEAMKLIKYMSPEVKFFIFSDSIDIAKKEFANRTDITFIPEQISGLESIFLMTNCNHNILANSTFSWWGAYLNKRESGYTVAPFDRYSEALYNSMKPKISHKFKSLYTNDVYPGDWIMLDVNNNYINDIIDSLNLGKQQRDDILQNYHKKKFNIYSGDKQELDICQDQNKKYFCKLSNEKKPTVVTAYYQIKSKYSVEKYDTWMKNFLKIPFNLVVYTDNQSAPKIQKDRGDLPIKMVIKDFNQLYHYKFYDKYQKMYADDVNQKHSPELYIVWADKVKFVNDAIEKNYYNSDFFVWCDIGTMRFPEYQNPNFPQTKYMLHNKVSFAILKSFDTEERKNKLMKNDVVRAAGNIQIGDRTSWKLYNIIWDKTVSQMMSANIDTSNDQRVMGNIALRYPELIDMVYPPLYYDKSGWWYLLLR